MNPALPISCAVIGKAGNTPSVPQHTARRAHHCAKKQNTAIKQKFFRHAGASPTPRGLGVPGSVLAGARVAGGAAPGASAAGQGAGGQPGARGGEGGGERSERSRCPGEGC